MSEDATTRAEMTGRCLCGTVTFTARDLTTSHNACHCGMCRRWSGGPLFGIHVGAVDFAGADGIVRYASSEWAERGFCAACGTNLFYYLKPADEYIPLAGVFDDSDVFTMTGEIYIDVKPDGYAFAGDHP